MTIFSPLIILVILVTNIRSDNHMFHLIRNRPQNLLSPLRRLPESADHADRADHADHAYDKQSTEPLVWPDLPAFSDVPRLID